MRNLRALLPIVGLALCSCLQVTRTPLSSRALTDEVEGVSSALDANIRKYQDLIEEYPKEPKYRERLSRLNWEKGDYRKAFAHLDKARRLDPENPVYDYIEGQYFVGLGNSRNAEQSFRRMIEKLPSDSYTGPHYELGLLYLSEDRIDDARTQFKICLRIDPKFALSHFRLAEISLRENNKQDAIHHFEEYLRLGGRHLQEQAIQRLYALQPELKGRLP